MKKLEHECPTCKCKPPPPAKLVHVTITAKDSNGKTIKLVDLPIDDSIQFDFQMDRPLVTEYDADYSENHYRQNGPVSYVFKITDYTDEKKVAWDAMLEVVV